MPQPWISYKVLKKLLRLAAILLGIGLLYGVYSEVNLFKNGYRGVGVIAGKRYFKTLGSDTDIQYEFKGQSKTVSISRVVEGTYGYGLGDKVSVFIDTNYPQNITISRLNTQSTIGYLMDHSFFFFQILLSLVFIGWGIISLFHKEQPGQTN